MDKNKVIQNAQKYVQKGQIDKAIREYKKIVEADPKDVRTRLKIGDLHAKKGNAGEAAEAYSMVAEAYSQQGFFLKAVAVHKQILKLQPDHVEVNLKLADLYHQLGLMSDAMAQFQTVVGHFEASGDVRSIFETLRKMLDIDPDNVATRIKLAELYSKEGMVQEAVEEFKQAADWLKERNRVDDYVKVLERLAYHQPDDIPLIRELANIYLAKGDTKRSLAKLQVCFKADPRDVETLHLLGQAFLELGQTNKTISVFKEMAKIHGDADRIDEQRAAWKKVLELAPEDPEAKAALGGRREAAQAGPPPGAAPSGGPPPGARPAGGPPPGARPAGGAPPGARPSPAAGPPPGAQAPAQGAAKQEAASSPAAMVAKLLTETDVYVKYGLHDKALEHLKKVFAIVPTHLEAHEKAKGLFETAGNTEAAAQELVTLIQLTIDSDADKARGYLKELASVGPHLPEFKGFVEKLGQPETEAVSFLDQEAKVVEAEDGDDELVIADDDDEILVADDSDGFTDEVEADDDDFGVDIAQDEEIEIEAPDDDAEVAVVADDDDDDAFVIEDDLLAEGDLDDAMAEAERSVSGDDAAIEADEDELVVDAGELEAPGEADVVVEPEPIGQAGVSRDEFSGLETMSGADDDDGILVDDPLAVDEPDDVADVTLAEVEPPREAASGESVEIEEPDPLEAGPEIPPPVADDGLGAPEAGFELDDEDDDEVTKIVVPELDLEAEEELEAEPPSRPEPEIEAPASSPEPEPEIDPDLDDELSAEDLEAFGASEDDLDFDDDELPSFTDDDGEAYAEPAEAPSSVEAKEETSSLTPEELEAFGVSEDDLDLDDDEPAQEEPEVEEQPAAAGEAAAPQKLPEEVEDEIEEAAFFLEQGLPDEAREVILGVLEAIPDHPEAVALLSRIESAGDGEEEELDVTDATEDTAEQVASSEAEPSDDRLETGEEDGGLEGFDDFDLADELADELAGLEDEEEGEAPLEDFQVSADDVFAEFKKGVAKTVGSEDAETHYDLGIAYREMGLTSDAIGEFELAAAQPKKLVESLTMIGLCHQELGNLDAARDAYLKCLASKGIKPAAAKAVHYDLGTVYAEQGEDGKAKYHFKKTVAIDKSFRDAKDRLASLAGVEEEPDGPRASDSANNGVPGADKPKKGEAPKRGSSKTSKIGYL